MSPLNTALLFLAFVNIKAITGSDLYQVSSEELKHFKQCVRGAQRPKFSECLGRSALSFIQRFDERENVSFVDDFVAVRSEMAAGRSLANVLDTDPVDFRGILENAGAVMGQRSLEWHMDGIYPGLMFKIGPTADANSVAEFVLADGGAQDERQFGFEDPTAGRLLAKQYMLPFLLGLKFNLVALVPLLFAGICLLLKKSLFLVKLAVYVSSFLGLGGILGSAGFGGGGFGGGGSFGGFSGANFGGAFGGHRPFGHFPGKTTVYGHGDEVHHQYDVHEPTPPYKRSERKVRFDQPREASQPSPMSTKRPFEDRFYDYENQRRQTNKLLAEVEDTAGSAESLMRNFQSSSSSLPSGMNGWQVVDCLGFESERLLEAAVRDNSTWHVNDYLSFEALAKGNDSESRARSETGLAGKLLQLFQGRALHLQMPRQLSISNAIDDFGSELGLDQGRKKKDKDKHMAMMGGMIMMATLAQMFLGKVILIAGSAFIMAKIALVISLLGSLKKGTTGHSGSSDHVIIAGGHSHESGWHRSMPTHGHSSAQQIEQIEEPSHDLDRDQAYYAYEAEPLDRRQFAQLQRPQTTTPTTHGFL
ncbi:uncharacterized protein [Drosophila tropicalis]|uniref:uncharacterized protein n=1 Tax=Drosophila tropicalis TaxID=46794 RepID=UPI0035AC0934